MNSFLKAEIERLKESENHADQFRGLLMEITCRMEEKVDRMAETQEATLVQTKLTNGRVNKAEENITSIHSRLTELEKPVTIELGSLWKHGKSFAAICVAFAGIVAGVAGTISGQAAKPDQTEIKAAVIKALEVSETTTEE
jgi:hypothetical protein